MTREEAFHWLNENVKSESLINHCLSVEASMRGYADQWGEDVEYWGMCGLLHDIDFEQYPETHPQQGAMWLKDKGFDEEFVTAVLGHGNETGVARESRLAKTLYAVDELSGFVIAVALMRPEKLEGMTPKSVKKKMKSKSFAKSVSREDIIEGAEDLGIDLSVHIQNVIDALTAGEARLNKEGRTLL